MRKLAFFMSSIVVLSACAAIALTAKTSSKTVKKTSTKVSQKAVAKPKAIPAAKPASTPKPTSLTLLYTSSAVGQIRSCNCTKFRFGGYGRELTLLKSIYAAKSDVALLEGGDIVGGQGFQARLKADVAAKALKMLGYHAIVPGDEDLGTNGSPTIKQFEKESAPVLCANLYTKGQDKLKYLPSRIIKTRHGLRVGVIGLIDSGVVPAIIEKSSDYKISDPKAALAKYLPPLQKQCDLVVLVFHGGTAAAEKHSLLKGVDIVLCTHRVDNETLFPTDENNEVEAKVEKRGSTYLIKAGTKENWCLGQLEMQLSKGKPTSVKHKLTYLDRRYEEDPAMVKVFTDYSENVKKAVLSESQKFLKQAEVLLVKRGLNPDDMRKRLRKSPFALSETCKDCHEEAHESWSKTRHAKAINSLQKTKQEFDPECVNCHVTGAVTRNGYVNFKVTPELANVQCESCHGPGLEHTENPEKGFGAVSEDTCRSCHTHERNPDFDYNTYWAKIKH